MVNCSPPQRVATLAENTRNARRAERESERVICGSSSRNCAFDAYPLIMILKLICNACFSCVLRSGPALRRAAFVSVGLCVLHERRLYMLVSVCAGLLLTRFLYL